MLKPFHGTHDIVQFSKNNENKDRPLISEAYFHYYHHKELHASTFYTFINFISKFYVLLSSCRLVLAKCKPAIMVRIFNKYTTLPHKRKTFKCNKMISLKLNIFAMINTLILISISQYHSKTLICNDFQEVKNKRLILLLRKYIEHCYKFISK